MNSQRDIERVLDDWLREGPDAVADRVIDTVADRIEHQSQRPAWHLRWRETHVTTKLKPVAAVVAVVAIVGLIAVLGFASRGNIAAPQPSATPSAAAFACYGDTTGCAGPLAAGEHASTNFLIPLTFTTPDGWVNVRDIRRTYGLESDTRIGAQIEVMGMNAIAEQTKECGPVRKAGVGSTVQDFIDAVQTHPGLVATDPVAVEIQGFQGRSIDFGVATGWDKVCPDDPSNPAVLLLTDTGEPPGRAIGYDREQHVRWTVIDVRGETVIIELVGPAPEDQFASSVEAVQPIIDSFEFGPAG